MKKYMLSAVLCCLMTGPGMEAGAAKRIVNMSSSNGDNDAVGHCDTNAYCFQKDQCRDTNCQDAIVACHQLSETKFNIMTASYSVPATCLGTFSAGYFRSMINNLDCRANDHISFNDASGTITFSVVTGTPYSSGTGRYSVAFFAGVLRQYAPSNNDMFIFYKVKDVFGNQSVGMKLVKGNVEVFYSDMTEVYP